MILHSMIVDDFFNDGESVREFALKQDYRDIVNPTDGRTYENVAVSLDHILKFELYNSLELLLGYPIEPGLEFFRLSKAGVKLPHQVHTDALMAEYTALIYLSRDQDAKGGTEVLKHIHGMETHPQTEEEIRIWERDTNCKYMWSLETMCPMKFNRLYLIRSDLYHRAEPTEGFGDSLESGRVVLVAFFKVNTGCDQPST